MTDRETIEQIEHKLGLYIRADFHDRAALREMLGFVTRAMLPEPEQLSFGFDNKGENEE